MSHLTYCRLTAILIGIISLNQVAIAATASERVAIIDRLTAQSLSRLDIGLQPIIQDISNTSSDDRKIDRVFG